MGQSQSRILTVMMPFGCFLHLLFSSSFPNSHNIYSTRRQRKSGDLEKGRDILTSIPNFSYIYFYVFFLFFGWVLSFLWLYILDSDYKRNPLELWSQYYKPHRTREKRKKKTSPFESMSLSASQCSEGCESGWTIYLNESSSPSSEESPRQEEFYRGGTKAKGEEEEEEEEENLSMVSDASSGQPFCEVEDDCSNKSCSSGKRRSKKKAAKENDNGKGEQQHLNYYYEDTACSPHLKFTEQEKIRSQNFHHDEKSAPAAEKANSVKKGGLKSRKWA